MEARIASMTIRNIDDTLKQRLRVRAASRARTFPRRVDIGAAQRAD